MRIAVAGIAAVLALSAAVSEARPKPQRETPEAEARRDEARDMRMDAKLRGRACLPGGYIHGCLVDTAGQGIGGLVALRTMDGCRVSQHVTFGVKHGRFLIDHVLPGRYQLTVDSLGPAVNEIEPPAPLTVTVVANQVSRPVIIARCE
jgi:hypothetical protein